jgi:two-component system cell cycle sensor histidine kinase/response regulator CckA
MLLDKDLTIKRVNQQFTDILGVPSPSQLQNNYLTNYLDEESIQKIKKQIDTYTSSSGKLQVAYFDLNFQKKKENKILRIYICPSFSSTLQIKENITGIILFCLDTTEQKNLETQFAQAQKMQAMGQLAGGIAHDFNNLLTAMIGFCDLLLQRHGPKDSSHADIIQIKQNANCAAELVRQLLQFSRRRVKVIVVLLSIILRYAIITAMGVKRIGKRRGNVLSNRVNLVLAELRLFCTNGSLIKRNWIQ